jgi:4-hydroxy-tetrahydrodipicolinate reductase
LSRVLVVGAGGRMGAFVLRAVEASGTLSVGAAVDRAAHAALGKEVSPGIALESDVAEAVSRCDVGIDFSVPDATLALVRAAEPAGLPLVIATTGLDAKGQDEVTRAARRIPIVQAGNYSLGVTVLLDLVAEAARRLPGYQLEVLEMHHDRKVDAPSGTALALARSAAEARGVKLEDKVVYHREGQTGPRPADAIGMQTLRMGDVVGEHTVFLAGVGERIELSHRALSRENFASGAVRAAEWVVGREPGLYSMRDVIA